MKKRNSWAILFEGHRKRRGLNQDKMAKLLSTTQGTVSDYETGKLLPPTSRCSDIADLLDLTGDERRTFIEEAFLAHAPDRIRGLVADLRSEIARSRRLLAKYDAQFPGLK